MVTWKEETWIWEPPENLFKELDLVPCYPKDVLESNRAQVDKGTKNRVGTYPNKYPDMRGKTVEIIEV